MTAEQAYRYQRAILRRTHKQPAIPVSMHGSPTGDYLADLDAPPIPAEPAR